MPTVDEKDITGDILTGIIACGVLACESDQKITEEEIDAIVMSATVVLERNGQTLDPDQVRTAAGEIAQLVSDAGAENFLADLPEMLAGDGPRRMGCVVAASIVIADGEVNLSEATMYGQVCGALGLSEEEAQQIWDDVTNSLAADDSET